MDPVIVLFGLGVGILIGLTGVGGGSLMTPLLLLAGGYSPTVAIGTDLAYGALTKTVGAFRTCGPATSTCGCPGGWRPGRCRPRCSASSCSTASRPPTAR